MTAKILLVDDVNMFLELQKGFLKLSSAQILTARDGQEALEVAGREHPDLVFMDLHMPRMDGAQCCTRLKADPLLRRMPVVLITAAGKEEDRDLCLRAGCDDFLTKPLDRLLFLEKARKYLPTIERRGKRVPCRAKVKFHVYGVSLSGEVYDVSGNGIYMATNYVVRVGTVLDVAFVLPDAAGTLIEAKGRVAWLNTPESRLKPALPDGFGIEFLDLGEEIRRALSRHVESQK